MASDKDEMCIMNHRLQFADSLKDLKNLKKHLYSAADCFESSYNKDNHKQFVVESSRDYVSKALVSTVDHLGSVADKLNKFLDKKTNEFSASIIQFSLIEQRLRTYQGFIHLRGLSKYFLEIEEGTSQNKHHVLAEEPEASQGSFLNSLEINSNLWNKGFEATRMKSDSALVRKEESRMPLFSFSRIAPSKVGAGTGRRSVSPLAVIKRSVSPTPSASKGRPRRAISASRRTTNEEMEESYTKTTSKDLFRAFLSLPHSRKDIPHKQIRQGY